MQERVSCWSGWNGFGAVGMGRTNVSSPRDGCAGEQPDFGRGSRGVRPAAVEFDLDLAGDLVPAVPADGEATCADSRLDVAA